MPKYIVIKSPELAENKKEIIADNTFDAVIKAGYDEDKLRPWDLRFIGSDWGSHAAKIRATQSNLCVVEYECDHSELKGNYFEILDNINYGVHTFILEK
jgi:hypothetical protein